MAGFETWIQRTQNETAVFPGYNSSGAVRFLKPFSLQHQLYVCMLLSGLLHHMVKQAHPCLTVGSTLPIARRLVLLEVELVSKRRL